LIATLTLASLTSHVGYAALVALVAVESAGIPVPGETALITAGVLAADHKLSIVLVIAFAAAAAIGGDNAGYHFGKRFGRAAMARPGRFENERRRALARAETFFGRHGPKAVFLGRWITGLRVWAAWFAGATHMRWRTFFLWNALGGIAWAISIGLAAYLLGHAAAKLIERFGEFAAIVVVIAGVVAFVVLRRRAEAAAESKQGDDAP
jgi:membrane-associated protein